MFSGECLLRSGFSESVEESGTKEEFDRGREHESSKDYGRKREEEFFPH
ncbi:MAG: hypothetical protein ACD_78C00257G0004, partial [uncultured bacterium (gcode 4)]